MPYEVVVTALYIGQGLANTIELIDTTNNTTEYLAVYDFGSSGGDAVHACTIVNVKAYNRYNSLPANQQPAAPYDNGYIDFLYISHLDKDHYNKLNQLNRFTIANLMIGGTGVLQLNPVTNQLWNQALIMLHNTIQPHHFVVNTFFLPIPGYTHPMQNPYDQPVPPVPPAGYATILFDNNTKALIFNPLCYQIHQNINTGSTMLLMSVLDTRNNNAPQFSALFTGDATRDTFIHFTGQVIQNPPPPPPPPPVPAPLPYRFNFNQETKFITMPHHGSYTTARDTANNINNPNKNPVRLVYLGYLLDNYHPDIAIASGYDHWGYKHPSCEVFDVFDKVVTQPPPVAPNPNITPPALHNIHLYEQNGFYTYTCNTHAYTTLANPYLGGLAYRNLILVYNTNNPNPLMINVFDNEFN